MKTKLREIMERKRVADTIKREIDHLNLVGIEIPELKEKGQELDAVVKDLTRKITQLEDFGIVLRDLETGLIDFPAQRFGEKVFLCWKYGEQDIEFWHTTSEGFTRRKQLKVSLASP